MGEREARTILVVHPSDELYGADRCLLELVRGLPASTLAVVALPLDIEYEGDLVRELVEARADVRRVDFAVLRRAALGPANWPRLWTRLTRGSWRLASIARASQADIVHTNTLAAVSGPIAAMLARRRHVWHVHETIADERWMARLVYRMLLLLPGSVIANSRATARALAGPIGVIRGKTSVIYPGIERATAVQRRSRRASASERLRIGFVGRLAPRKGIGELLEAVALVSDRGIALELDVFGTAPPGQKWREEHYRRRARGLGLSDVVSFHGFVSDIETRLEEVDVLVVPSQRPEPFGLVVLEGMAAGCAVVVTRNGGGSDEIIEPGVTGLSCGLGASSIAAAIERLAGDVSLRERLGEQARAAVQERFSVDRYRDDVRRVCQRSLR